MESFSYNEQQQAASSREPIGDASITNAYLAIVERSDLSVEEFHQLRCRIGRCARQQRAIEQVALLAGVLKQMHAKTLLRHGDIIA